MSQRIPAPSATRVPAPTAEALALSRAFGPKLVLQNLSLQIHPGEIHALLGPNGAGKTTLLRILGGLIAPTGGEVRVLGEAPTSRHVRARIGWVPSGDRNFYLRISGLENLVFFGRMYGLPKRRAASRARELLELVGLGDAVKVRVGFYSHGMLKRLAVARGLLPDPAFLLVDEATHDLDPEGTEQVKLLIRTAADQGAAVVWATQRLDEIRDFADTVTVLGRGTVRFSGSVADLIARVKRRGYLVQLENGWAEVEHLEVLRQAVAPYGTISPRPDQTGLYALHLEPQVVLGDALAAITSARFPVLACREERSVVEQAFMEVTEDDHR